MARLVLVLFAFILVGCGAQLGTQRALASATADALVLTRQRLELAYARDMVEQWRCGGADTCASIAEVDDKWQPAFRAWEAAVIAHDAWADALESDASALDLAHRQRLAIGATCVAAALAGLEVPTLCEVSQ